VAITEFSHSNVLSSISCIKLNQLFFIRSVAGDNLLFGFVLSKPPQTELEAGFRGLHVEDVKEDTMIASASLQFPPSGVPDLPTAQPIYATAAWRLNSVENFEEAMKGVGWLLVVQRHISTNNRL
jgi:hypothetical protein